jgi:pimeloyl-ACP methyl ester carboxylesterase
MAFVTSDDGLKIYYEQRGSGPAVLLSHGFRASSAMWQYQMEALSDRYRVIAWDMRGHGRSDSLDDLAAYSLEHSVADMLAVLRSCGVERAATGGLSLGGLVSLGFCLALPHRTVALMLFDTGPGQRKVAPQGGEAKFRTEPPGWAHTRRAVLERPDDEIMASLASIRVPCLILCGEFDLRYLAATDLLVSKIPSGEKVILKGAGHVSNLDRPDLFNASVRSFLDRVSSW